MGVKFVKTDGGRRQAEDHGRVPVRRRVQVGDCVTRAITLAGVGDSYEDNWHVFANWNRSRGKRRSADSGVNHTVWIPMLKKAGFKIMNAHCNFFKSFGSVKNVAALIKGTAIFETNKHLVCVRDGDILDTWDSSRCHVKRIFLHPDAELVGGYFVDADLVDYRRMLRDVCYDPENVYQDALRDLRRWHPLKRHAEEIVKKWRYVYPAKPEDMMVVKYDSTKHPINYSIELT